MLRLTEARKTIHLPGGSDLAVLRNASLRVARGDSVAILGRSGSGKSTLLGLLGLMDTLDAGSYEVDGASTARLGDRELARMRGGTFGFVYQRFCLMSHLSALENVVAPLWHVPRRHPAKRRKAMAALEAVGLQDRARHRPTQLSGGEQQRVAIARALVHEPKVILADEPTGSLDVDTGAEVLDLTLQLVRDTGVSLVVVTHDPQIASRLSRVVEIDEGTILEAKRHE